MSRQRVGCLVLVLAAATLAGAIACGRKADPRPPEFVVPRSPDPVVVENVTDGIKLIWRRPRTYIDGTNLDDLGSFRVLRACDEEQEFQVIAEVPVTDRERFRKTSSFTLVDHDVPIGSTCLYRVVAETLDNYTSVPADSWYLTRAQPTPATPSATPLPGAAKGAGPPSPR